VNGRVYFPASFEQASVDARALPSRTEDPTTPPIGHSEWGTIRPRASHSRANAVTHARTHLECKDVGTQTPSQTSRSTDGGSSVDAEAQTVDKHFVSKKITVYELKTLAIDQGLHTTGL
jgi:hypothetical protein